MSRTIFLAANRVWLFFALLVCFSLQAYLPSRATSRNAPLVSTTTRDGRLAVFDDVWETIEERYYDPNFRGVDWQERRLTFRPLAAEANGTQQFYDVLRQMIAALRDAHTRIYSPEEKFDWWKPRFVTVGTTIREVDQLPTIVRVDLNSSAARAGLRSGDVITNIDDQSPSELLLQRLRTLGVPIEPSTHSHATTSLLEGAAGTSVKISWQDRSGKTKEATLERTWTERSLGFQIIRKGKLAVIKLDVFTEDTARQLVRTLPDTLRKTNGIILDLRANGGGDAQAMAEIASVFFDYGVSLGTFSDRSTASFELRTNARMLTATSSVTPTRLPLVVLTSEGTSSAAEILAAALQRHARAHVIGTPTCGCVLAIRNRHTLPDGGVLDVSELDYRTAEGVRLEGLGVNPDELVPVRRSDLYRQRDGALKAAEKYLGQ